MSKKPIATKKWMPDNFKSSSVLYVINFINVAATKKINMKSIPGFDFVMIEILDLLSSLNNLA